MAKVIFQDEQGQNLNRYVLTPVEGQANTYDLTRAATITQQGTPYSKEVGDHFLQVEDGIPAQTLACTKSSTVYALTGLTATSGKVPVLFAADSAYAAGDTVTIDGTAYALATRDGSALTAGAWAAEAIVTGTADVDNKVLTVEPSVPHTKADIGLGSVDNTADANKSVSYAATAGSAADTTTINSALTVSTAAPTSTLAAGKLWGVYDA